MNLEARKIEFVQEFLKLQSEEVISLLENILKNEKREAEQHFFISMSEEQFNKRIDQSELDFQNNRFEDSATLLAKYE